MTKDATPREVGLSEGLGAWLPIATAPRDGRWLLLTGGAIEYGWCEDSRPPMVVAQACADGWQFAWFDSGYYGEYENPTHWMPLPAPPAGSACAKC